MTFLFSTREKSHLHAHTRSVFSTCAHTHRARMRSNTTSLTLRRLTSSLKTCKKACVPMDTSTVTQGTGCQSSTGQSAAVAGTS